MQLDTGSPYTLFYQDKLSLLNQGTPPAELVGDTLLNTIRFTLGGKAIERENVKVIKHKETASTLNEEPIIVGTLGMDVIEPYVLTLDFLHQEFFLSESIPDSLRASITETDFYYSQHHILFPVMLLGQRKMVYFDSGSSAFPLLIDKANWQKLINPDSLSASYSVSSWSKSLKATTQATSERVIIANESLPLQRVTYIDGASQNQVNQMLAMGIGGMVGNQLFIGTVLVIDLPHKKFGVYRPR